MHIKEASQLAIGQTQAVDVGTATNVGVKTNVNDTNIQSTNTAMIGTNLKGTNMEKTGAAAFGNATINIQGDVPNPSSGSGDEDSSDEDD